MEVNIFKTTLSKTAELFMPTELLTKGKSVNELISFFLLLLQVCTKGKLHIFKYLSGTAHEQEKVL